MPTLVIRQSPSSTTTSNTSTQTAPVYNQGPTGGSTTLYLFTFLITILVLGLISSGLLIRAYILRRRFHRRVEEAMRRGEALPQDAAAALGLLPRRTGFRGKKEKKHGLMPTMWESEMRRSETGLLDDDENEIDLSEKEWDNLTPLSVLHFTNTDPTPPPTQVVIPPQPTPAAYIRSLFSSNGLPTYGSRPPLTHRPTSTVIPTSQAVFAIPEPGEEVVVGVMIAMPCEGVMEERWNLLEEGEERELPEVCLGVMSTRIKE
ncbi:uncharacterized protein IL334_002681 [Kwoniella shivajii]|uniref:Uncharacterized protein n=1 Tax=Kwoniella shivajii TaxID=564305 RepID=A0ABZ1CVG0_9TREE|nr:hypothetical protein IL334_002681 [Kwoniella shivajii]